MNLCFKFKGNRDYVHGTDIYNTVIERIKHELCEISSFDISFHGISRTNIRLLENKPEDKNIKFIVKYNNHENDTKVLFGVENDIEILERYPYPEENIYRQSELSSDNKSIELNNKTGFSFIENIVALNKHMLEQLFKNINGKWFFTRLQLKRLSSNDNDYIKLLFKHNMNFKLTKSEIFVNNIAVGYIYFSLL